jgi:hypothetical protein
VGGIRESYETKSNFSTNGLNGPRYCQNLPTGSSENMFSLAALNTFLTQIVTAFTHYLRKISPICWIHTRFGTCSKHPNLFSGFWVHSTSKNTYSWRSSTWPVRFCLLAESGPATERLHLKACLTVRLPLRLAMSVLTILVNSVVQYRVSTHQIIRCLLRCLRFTLKYFANIL